LIRHAPSGAAMPVGALAVAVVEPTFRGLLVSAIGAAALIQANLAAATDAAIPLSAVATRTNEEECVTAIAQANS
jgi:hypothetical protein